MRYLTAGDCVLDTAEQKLMHGEETVQLSTKPFLVLSALMQRGRTLVSKDDLIEAAWDGRVVSESVVTTVIKELRQLLGDSARQPTYIETVHGRGYRFLLPVEIRDVLELAPAIGDERTQATHSATAVSRMPQILVGILFAAGLLIVFASLMQDPPDNEDLTEQVLAPGSASVAVLPFSDLSAAGDQNWFADGLTEELLDSLSQTPGLLVASKRSSSLFTNNSDKISDIAQELEIDYLIEGSIRQIGDQQRISVRLVRTTDGFQVWSQSFDRSASAEDVFQIQSEIATAVATRFGVTTGVGLPDSNASTNSTKAYEAYRRARTLMERRGKDSLDDSVSQFELAIRADPDFGPAHAGLAEAKMLAIAYAGAPDTEWRDDVRSILDRASELSPNAQETLRAEALFHIGARDFQSALDYSDRAVRANPNDSESHRRRGSILLNMSRISEAADAFEAARLREPTSPIVLVNLTDLAIISGELKKALDFAQQAKRWNPNDPLGDFALGSAYYALSDYSAAHFAWRRALSANPQNQLAAIRLGELYWRLGMPERALDVVSPTPWMLDAGARLSTGDVAGIREIVSKNPSQVSNILPSITLLYLARDYGAARTVAQVHLDRWMLLDGVSYEQRNRATTIALYGVLRAFDDPRAGQIKSQLDRYFSDLGAGEVPLATDLYIGAAVKMIDGDQAAALNWIEEAANRGVVLRELRWDPVFDAIRKTAPFEEALSEMERVAELNRNTVEAQLAQ